MLVKEIKLTKGFITVVDSEDFERINKYKWRASKFKGSKTWYAVRDVSKPKKGLKLLHREILELDDRRLHVDHKDCNGLNNCKDNLRYCFPENNVRNIGLTVANTSGYKGVSKRKDIVNKTWAARIRVNKKLLSLGCFETAKEAALAYDEAALRYHGEFAKTNKELGLL